jgi:hypothetical protein
LTQTQFPELRSDARGAFELHLYAEKRDAGHTTVEVASRGCSANTSFDVEATRFPAEACDAVDKPAPTGSAGADSYAQLVTADQPAAYWRFEEAGGSTTTGLDGRQASLSDGATLGQPGALSGSRAVLLDGQNARIDIPDFNFEGDFTIEAWIRFCGEFIGFQDGLVGQGSPGARHQLLRMARTTVGR